MPPVMLVKLDPRAGFERLFESWRVDGKGEPAVNFQGCKGYYIEEIHPSAILFGKL